MRNILRIAVISLPFLLIGCGQVAPNNANGVTANPSLSVTESIVVTNRVAITGQGFEPAIIRIKPGTTVVWTNQDSAGHWVASDPHPIHTGLKDFDAELAIAPNQTFEFSFSKIGEWPYHDHLRPVTYTGLVIVSE